MEELGHVYWIGGGSVAGKSTLARRIAARHRFHLYATDEVMSEHAGRSTPEDAPLLHAFMAMDMDRRWVHRSPGTMLETFPWFQGECFDMIVDDLLRLPRKPGVIVEGFRLLPRLVKPLLAVPSHAVWLVPTPAFRRSALERRGQAWEFLARTRDPERALRNLLERDAMFAERLYQEAMSLDLPFAEVDISTTEHRLANQVEALFGL